MIDMAEVLYTVAVTFPRLEMVDDWIRWLCDGHVADVLAGGATQAEIVRIDGSSLTYEVRYRFPSCQHFDAYEREHAPRLREEGRRLFPPEQGVVYQRTVGERIAGFPDATGAARRD
jgi:hypothetical protein